MSTIHDTFDYGYDPSVPEEAPLTTPPRLAALPSAASVDSTYLPPVGQQTMPNCFVWAPAYGLVTFWAALAGNYSPTAPSQQASPDYTYIQVEVSDGVFVDTCVGGQMTHTLNWVKQNGGTPSLATAPDIGSSNDEASCAGNWSAYGPPSSPLAPDSIFAISGYTAITVTGPDGLDNMRTVIASGLPLAYGTYLYTDFPGYDGTPSPYVGNGIWLYNKKTGKKAGHCMMIIGYDDSYNGSQGAVLIQNSFGTNWGSNGLIWMAYATFQAMAQGGALYIPS